MYYAAMLIFTWGEIINTIADGPYLSARTPASHRGRINSVSGVAYTILRGIFNIAEGKAYDAYGSTAAWGLTIGALTISILLSVWLIFRDRARYPRLYEENAGRTGEIKISPEEPLYSTSGDTVIHIMDQSFGACQIIGIWGISSSRNSSPSCRKP